METPRPHTPCIPTMCTLMQDRSLRGVRGTPSTHHALERLTSLSLPNREHVLREMCASERPADTTETSSIRPVPGHRSP